MRSTELGPKLRDGKISIKISFSLNETIVSNGREKKMKRAKFCFGKSKTLSFFQRCLLGEQTTTLPRREGSFSEDAAIPRLQL